MFRSSSFVIIALALVWASPAQGPGATLDFNTIFPVESQRQLGLHKLNAGEKQRLQLGLKQFFRRRSTSTQTSMHQWPMPPS